MTIEQKRRVIYSTNTRQKRRQNMTNKQAIAYIESIMSNYEVSKIKDWTNPMYRQVTMWLSDKDIIALKLGIEALKEKDNEQ